MNRQQRNYHSWRQNYKPADNQGADDKTDSKLPAVDKKTPEVTSSNPREAGTIQKYKGYRAEGEH